MFPQVQVSQVSDPVIRQALQLLTLPLNKILSIEMLDGLKISSVSLKANTELQIPHKLGREYLGYLITSKNANANVWTSSTDNKDKYLNLTSSADVTVDIWVY